MAESDPVESDDEPPPRACSYAELTVAESLAERLSQSGREVLWRPVWVRSEPELTFALAAILATALGLAALSAPIPAGISLAVLLALWSLEVGGLPSPLSLLRPERATQDVIASDPKGPTGVKSVLLLVRSDLPRRPSRLVARVCSRGPELAWLAIAVTLATVAARALDQPAELLDAIQFVPAIGSLVLLSFALLARAAPLAEAGTDPWTGIQQALDADGILDCDPDDPRRCDIVVAGATGIGGAGRVLSADKAAVAACSCWRYPSGEEIVAEVRRMPS